jgi:hypothetical protein
MPPPPLERKPRLAIILWAVSEGARRSQCVYTATLFAALIAPANEKDRILFPHKNTEIAGRRSDMESPWEGRGR